MNGPCRCAWVNLRNPLYVEYHDREWGRRPADDQALYERFILETFQAGLSWECVLNRRAAIKAAFDGFDAARIAAYGEADLARLMATDGIIRNRAKLGAVVANTRAIASIRAAFGSFGAYVESFAGKDPVVEPYTERTTSPVSDALSADMRRRGMKFVGSTTVYAFLQAAGFIDGHGPECRFGSASRATSRTGAMLRDRGCPCVKKIKEEDRKTE